MARPVVASAIGPLPEIFWRRRACRTMCAPAGWCVQETPASLRVHLRPHWALDAEHYRALAARARQFGEFAFSPQRAAAVMLEIYTSLLAVDR